MKIIKANKSHSKEIIRLVAALLSEIGGKQFVVDEVEALEFINQSMANGKYIAFLAFDGDEFIGIITVGESGAVYTSGTFGVIHEFYIAPDMRSGGLGYQMIEKVKQTAMDMNWKRLEVGTPPYPEWKRTKRFYLREGFLEIGPRLKWMAAPTVAPD